MARLAIISSYNENCGNASYTHVLKKGFSEHVDVDVIPLDLFLLQKRSDLFRSAADRHIKEIAAKLSAYDYVNIQFEAGLFGSKISDTGRRISWLIEAAPNLILTMHRIDIGQLPWQQALGDSLRTRSFRPWRIFTGGQRFADLYRFIIRKVERASRTKNAWIKVHTRRERRIVTDIYKFKNCFDYPLAFLAPEERASALAHTDRQAFLSKHGFGEGDRVVGLFGYISEYKGIETAIQSMANLPDNFKLALFGSHHPQSIRSNTPLHPYLESLVDLMEGVDEGLYQRDSKAARLRRLNGPKILLSRNGRYPEAVGRLPMNDRVRFIGSLADPEFIEALRLCDVVVLPYIEVGQSMSGVVVLGLEAGARMLCASNHSFAEVKRYFGDVFGSFDMGNHIELAQKIQSCVENSEAWEYGDARAAAYCKYNIRLSVAEQLSYFGHKIS